MSADDWGASKDIVSPLSLSKKELRAALSLCSACSPHFVVIFSCYVAVCADTYTPVDPEYTVNRGIVEPPDISNSDI